MSAQAEMVIGKIDAQEGRVRIYSRIDTSFYHVIASADEAKNLKLGDTIEYDLNGAGYGWFLKKK